MRSRRLLDALPFGLLRLERRMGDQQVPDHGLEGFGVRRDRVRVHRRDDADRVADLGRVAAVAADHAEDLRADRLGILQRAHEIGADVLLEIAAADREHEQRVLRLEPAHLEPLDEHRLPAFVVGARGEFRDVVGRRIGLDADDLAEVVDRVRALPALPPTPRKNSRPPLSAQRRKRSAMRSITATSSASMMRLASSRCCVRRTCAKGAFWLALRFRKRLPLRIKA